MSSIHSIALHLLGRQAPYLVLALVLGLLAAAWAYRRTLAPLSARLRGILWVLRAAALLIAVFMLFQPLLSLVLRSGEKPRLVLLADRSGSMAMPDGSGKPRAGAILAAAGQAEERLRGSFETERRAFAGSVAPVAGSLADIRPLDGAPTAIGAALREVFEADPDRPVGGVILASDGIGTSGPDPVEVARRYRVPVYPLLPPEAEIRDALVASVVANPVAYQRTELPVQVTVKGIGSRGEVVKLRLKEGDQILAEREVALGAGGALRDVILSFTPTVPGMHFYAAEVSPLAEEATEVNNSRHFAVDVREEKTRVLVLEGRLTWDFTFMKRALERDTTLAYTFLVRERDGGWEAMGEKRVARPPSDASGLRSFSAVVLGDVSPDELAASQWAALAEFVDGGGGLIVAGGRPPAGLSRLAGTALARVLPVRIAGPSAPGPAVDVMLGPAGRGHPVTGVAGDPVENERLWKGLAPVLVSPGDIAPAPGADILLAARGSDRPLLIGGRYGRGKTLVLAAHETWRWGFLVPAVEQAGLDVHDRLWLQAVRWVVEPFEVSRLNVSVSRPVLERGEDASFTATVYDEELRPVENAEVAVTLSADGSEREVRLAPAPGGYAGSAGALPPGTYRYRASARAGGRTVGEDEGTFLVDAMGPEYVDLLPDRGLLLTLAEESGGRAFEGDAVASIASEIPRTVRVLERTREYELWMHPALFAALMAALGGEWFLRRRHGLA
jgi:uncharacterized membrane protein